MILYGELTKLEPQDDGSIRVHGIASSGARDGAGELVTPDAMRAALPAYMAFGAIREMHQPRAAGAALHAEVDEEGATRICAHVVDPLAVRKVKAGVYKGLSIGGKVLARDADDPSCITSIRLDEISLVDRPCNPEAVIDLWKAAAAPALVSAPSNEAVRAEAERMAKAAGRPGRRNDYVAAARAKLSQSLPLADGGGAGVGVEPPRVQDLAREAPPEPLPKLPAATPIPALPLSRGKGANTDDTAETASEPLAKLQGDLARLSAERETLEKRLADQAAEIARLKAAPLPPKTASSPLARSIAKCEDGEGPLSPNAFADALAALPAAERAHLIMKAALARPMPLSLPAAARPLHRFAVPLPCGGGSSNA